MTIAILLPSLAACASEEAAQDKDGLGGAGKPADLSSESATAEMPAGGMTLVFEDGFDGPALDTDIWNIVEGDGCPAACGFGNNELQTYGSASENLRIEDGILVIEAHHTEGERFSSAKITTEHKASWQYGRVSVRAKLAKGLGTWPAAWMLPDGFQHDQWPRSGEIDIIEHVGYDPGVVHGTIHTEAYNHKIGTQVGKAVNLPDAMDAFHTYTVEWDADEVRWFVDGEKYHSFPRIENATEAEWPLDKKFHLILNLAIGGDWGGQKGIDYDAYPARYEIDWVKVWQ